ncbi:g8572 [Coccomyxa viridis]|uniref:G8572 protein n=1 Tax=Coccomyxa viridis TaxID=1274662 RepID=A0ABP1G0P2_9CHLO
MEEAKEDVGTGTLSRVVPPLLPSQLAVCAPLPELKLFVAPDQGEKFLAMSQGSIVPDAGPARSSSWANLQQHLAELTLGLHPGRGNAQLGSLGMLTALKMLIIRRGRHHPENPRRDLSGEKIVLKLPNLAFLHILQDVDHMTHLEQLVYTDFPAACMPQSFPKSLQSITLFPQDRDYDVPRGLKALTNLTELTFGSGRMSWDPNVPLAELLLMDSLQTLTLGTSRYVRQDNAGKGIFKQV